jgi:galactonate dehydratase
VREAVGDAVELMIEVHGRLSAGCAIEMGQRLAPYRPAWYEEPITPYDLDLLKVVKLALPFPIAAGERLYMLEEFERLCALRACDVVQPDLAHCGGVSVGKKIAALAQAHDLSVSPHCSVGPVALCAALHFDWATPNVRVQENFAEYDVPWRNALVRGWNPIRHGEFVLPDRPGLGIELDDAECARHPYRKNSFPSLWDDRWLKEFTKAQG